MSVWAAAPAGAALFVLGLLLFCQRMFTTADVRQEVDAIVLLGGRAMERADVAARVYAEGWSKRVLVPCAGDWSVALQELKRRGVPEPAIWVEGDSRPTKENAEKSMAMLATAGVKQIIIVTSWIHSRRAKLYFEMYLQDGLVLSVPSYAGERTARLPDTSDVPWILKEYLKYPWYQWRHGVDLIRWPAGTVGSGRRAGSL